MVSNHNYNQPSQGTTDWHIPLNDNFESLDSDVEIRDSEGNLDSYTPKSKAKFLATDTRNIYLGDGDQWNFFGTIGGDSSGGGEGPPSNVAYASKFPGSTLSDKVRNALDSLPDGKGKVVITPKSDGSRWTWGSTLSLSPVVSGGIEIECVDNTVIEYDGSGFVFDVEPTGDVSTDYYDNFPRTNTPQHQFKLTGGDWICTSSTADGWVKVTDTYGMYLSPRRVHKWFNNSGNCTCVLMENNNSYCESCKMIGGMYSDFDIGVLQRCQSGAHGSFDNFYMQAVDFDTFKNTGFRAEGHASHHASSFVNVRMWPNHDGTTCFHFGNLAHGTSLINPKVENYDDDGTCTFIDFQGPSNYAPSVIDPCLLGSVDPIYVNGSAINVWPEGSDTVP